jgi:hypothetical protein
VAEEPEERIHISVAQVAASSAAAVTAAVVCSFFGVAGTMIGTAVASIMATVGSAIYVHSLRRTRSRLRRLHQAGAVSPPFTEVVKTARQQGNRLWGQLPVRALAIGAVSVFAISILVITGIELGIGETFSGLFGVGNSGSRGTTIGSAVAPHHHSKPSPAPKSSPSSPPASSTRTTSPPATPRPTTTVAPTATPTQPSSILPSLPLGSSTSGSR